jgi:two-component system sensor histidine kinase PilS (NtrC family)
MKNNPVWQIHSIHNHWQQLRIFNIYRITAVSVLLVAFLFKISAESLGQFNPEMYFTALIVYLFLSILGAFTSHFRSPPFISQIYLFFLIDLIFLTLLIHSSGGLISGIGILLIVSVAGNALLHPGQYAFLFAAIATLTLFMEAFYTIFFEKISLDNFNGYSQIALHGLAFFSTAFISNALSKRAEKSEKIALEQGYDLANLEILSARIIQEFNSGIVALDHEGKVRLLNQAAAQMFTELIPPHPHLRVLQPQLFEKWQLWRREPYQETFLLEIKGKKVDIRFLSLGSSSRAGTLIFMEDRQVLQKRLQQDKLAAIGRLTASIAHEIRNPLGAISHAAQLLAENPKLKKNDQRLVEIVLEQSKRMNRIIMDILQLSSSRAGQGEWFYLLEWLLKFKESLLLSQHLEHNQVKIFWPDHKEKISIYFDKHHLQQILYNLCQNAIDHGTPANGTICIFIKIYLSNKLLHIGVYDRGEGVEKSILPHLFEPFATSRSDGSGLGLYLSRELAQLNKAELEYQPQNNGSGFIILISEYKVL